MVTFHPSFWKREAMGHSHTFPNPCQGLLQTLPLPKKRGRQGPSSPCLLPSRRRMGVAMTTPSPLPCESKMRVTTMPLSLVKIRTAEATILNFSRGEGERSWSPSTLPSGRGRPWAIATPFLLLVRDCCKPLHFPRREGGRGHSLLASFLLEQSLIHNRRCRRRLSCRSRWSTYQ